MSADLRTRFPAAQFTPQYMAFSIQVSLLQNFGGAVLGMMTRFVMPACSSPGSMEHENLDSDLNLAGMTPDDFCRSCSCPFGTPLNA